MWVIQSIWMSLSRVMLQTAVGLVNSSWLVHLCVCKKKKKGIPLTELFGSGPNSFAWYRALGSILCELTTSKSTGPQRQCYWHWVAWLWFWLWAVCLLCVFIHKDDPSAAGLLLDYPHHTLFWAVCFKILIARRLYLCWNLQCSDTILSFCAAVSLSAFCPLLLSQVLDESQSLCLHWGPCELSRFYRSVEWKC